MQSPLADASGYQSRMLHSFASNDGDPVPKGYRVSDMLMLAVLREELFRMNSTGQAAFLPATKRA